MHSEAHSPRCRQARSTSFWLGCESSQPARVLGPPALSGIFAAMGGSKSTGASAPVPAAGSKPNNLDKFDVLGPNYVGQAGSTSVRGGVGQSGSTAIRGGGGSASASGASSAKPRFQTFSPGVMDTTSPKPK